MNLLIVDDEPLARAELLRLCGELLPGFRSTEASNLAEARSALLRESFDGVLLDMELGGYSGLDLIPDAKASGTPVVISTAHERFAVDAYDADVVDYLLKPVEVPRLFRAITKLSKMQKQQGDELVLLSDQCNCWPVKPSSILLVEAEGSYCKVLFTDRKELTVSRSLKEMEQMLATHSFIRANRGQMVNLNLIKVIHRQSSGRLVAELEGHEDIEFSRRQAQAFRSKFSL
ncbi:LytTR family DNA-binding domain-containing protein [Luteolibacter sp. GHJ8]|jgi:two-component system LytT family response regulator|uniref:LytTR family DNA-binding domain-containing protein n=1 Tax=Luteolibacter rhizosphaerae TaxID=2989719 RepID=A0ABT3G3Y7_9BACT|nr:LytTR family DNA-binding domain-containing protein [Luteolibacter rhizosphaerae]MCW1914558.1 LytTR family DNA-binding domain-containing protein [Luteolibacter rhizosphaerae]